jgi:NAD(P)-dependent dehydrogenase (short-subunit alcohol dehydrogenase family)
VTQIKTLTSCISKALDAAVVPGFSKIGYRVRQLIGNWQAISDFDLLGKTVVITGPTSGLGEQVARQLAPTGANLVLVARNEEKCARVIDEIAPLCTGNKPVFVQAEMGDLESVRSACAAIQQQFTHLDVLVHNAGALLNTRQISPQGIEQTVASHVVGPFLMTTLLLPLLVGGRVVTVSSGGMYTSGLPVFDNAETLEMPDHKYGGSKQYAIAKRAQVTLTEMWAEREPQTEFVSMHPGWADTPGVQESIPGFRRVTAPILRSAAEGADTIAWLAAVQPLPGKSGSFWSDREIRPTHKSSRTKKSDTISARTALWERISDYIVPFIPST